MLGSSSHQQHSSRVGNRRREGYELTKQRDMWPIALGAACAAALMHAFVFIWGPSVIHINLAELFEPKEEVKDETVRVIVKHQPEEEQKEAPTMEAPPPTNEPLEIEHEPLEIDILDADVEELVMAPGETEITIPEPVYQQEAAPSVSDLPPAQIDLSQMMVQPVPREALNVPEPAPVNSNDVVANVEAQPETTDEASQLMDAELRSTATQSGTGELPGDTRSLAELLGEADPGAKSGVARLGADVLFGFNESILKNSARITMLQLAALIQKNPDTQFIIEGHTDSLGGDDYNALLGLQRAAAVRSWLVGNDVPVKNVYIRSCGCSAPLVSTKQDKEKQAMNRRVEIHMRKKGEKLPSGCMDSKYEVDMKTSVRVQVSRGVKVPLSKSLTVGIKEKEAEAKKSSKKSK